MGDWWVNCFCYRRVIKNMIFSRQAVNQLPSRLIVPKTFQMPYTKMIRYILENARGFSSQQDTRVARLLNQICNIYKLINQTWWFVWVGKGCQVVAHRDLQSWRSWIRCLAHNIMYYFTLWTRTCSKLSLFGPSQ